MKNMIVTPVSKVSRKDFREQEESDSWMWDDVSPVKYANNQSKVGDIFAFVFNSEKIQFHIITGVGTIEDRCKSWEVNTKHQDRRALFLSDPICIMTWEKWIELGGLKMVFGSRPVVRPKIRDYITLKLTNDFMNLKKLLQLYTNV
jgi:hypothetical protein